MDGDVPRLLPVWRIVIDAYWATFENWRYAIRISWAWLLVVTFVDVATEVVFPLDDFLEGGSRAGLLLTLLVETFALCSIAVAWHRKVLCAEEPPEGPYLRSDLTVWRYLGYFFLIKLIFALAKDISLGLLIAIGPMHWILNTPLAVIALVAMMTPMLRFSIVLPAQALQMPEMTLPVAWHLTRKSTGEILLGTILCSLPKLALPPLIELIADVSPGPTLQYALYSMFYTAISWLAFLIALSFLSFTFWFFFVSDDETPEAPTSPSP